MPSRDPSTLLFRSVYPLYVQKAERKQRTSEEVDAVICWLTGYSTTQVAALAASEADFRTFFEEAPALHPDRMRIKGLICGHRVEEIPDPLTRSIRILDKLIDDLAKGRALEKILHP